MDRAIKQARILSSLSSRGCGVHYAASGGTLDGLRLFVSYIMSFPAPRFQEKSIAHKGKNSFMRIFTEVYWLFFFSFEE